MPAVSALGQFTLTLHRWAEEGGRLTVSDVGAEVLLETLAGRLWVREDEETEFGQAGRELRVGRPRNEVAKKVQRAALRHLRSLDLTLRAIDELGYSPVLVRALFQNHYEELRHAALGSDANCAYVDVQAAVSRASDSTREVAALLSQGLGPQEIGERLATNGSRRISVAMAELARLLSGRATAT